MKKLIRQFVGVIREWKKSRTRSPKWSKTRKNYLKSNPVCEICGAKTLLQVHHIMPFHLHPELELDSANFIALCMSKNECHLNIGHGGNWKCYNPNIIADAQTVRANPKMLLEIVYNAKANRLTDD